MHKNKMAFLGARPYDVVIKDPEGIKILTSAVKYSKIAAEYTAAVAPTRP
jgi:hypothetical protein